MLAWSSISSDWGWFITTGLNLGLTESPEPDSSYFVFLLRPRRKLILSALLLIMRDCLRTAKFWFVMFIYGMLAPSSSASGNSMKLLIEADMEEIWDKETLSAAPLLPRGLGSPSLDPCSPDSTGRR